MLPEELSNDLCSLVPNKNRKSIIVEINLINGVFKSFKLHRGEIKSVARLTYTEVERIYLNEDSKNEFYEIVLIYSQVLTLLKKNRGLEKKLNLIQMTMKLYLRIQIIFNLKKKLS